VCRNIARLQALLNANDQTLRNLGPEVVDIAPIDGCIWETESGGNDLLVSGVSTQTNYVCGKNPIMYLTGEGEECALHSGAWVQMMLAMRQIWIAGKSD
jgi:hypothetical protein